MRQLRVRLGVSVVLALAAVMPVSGQALAGGEVRVEIEGALGPGPAEFNRVWVRKYGSDSLGHVLLLMPGSPAGQANFDVLAPILVEHVPDLAVWTIDRRENGLENGSGFTLGDPDLALFYYFLEGVAFAPVRDDEAPFVRQWGATVTLEDLRRVVLAARDGGRRGVILGGHSAGAVIAPTYAVWDFAGSPGYRDLAGLVLIDGMQLGAFSKALAGTPFETPWATVDEARAALDALEHRSPFGFAGEPDVPLWIVGVLVELACQYARLLPQEPARLAPAVELLTMLGLMPPGFLPDVVITNEALAGVLFSSRAVPALAVRVGHLASTGEPRPWVNGPLATVPQVCETYTREPGNGMAWYYPMRLEMDLLLGAPSLQRTPVSDFLGLRPFHLAEVDLPLYAFETSLGADGILPAARELIARSRITRVRLESDHAMGHLDPLYNASGLNRFIDTVIPFLREITTGRAADGAADGVTD